jgi:hypothetical protein
MIGNLSSMIGFDKLGRRRLLKPPKAPIYNLLKGSEKEIVLHYLTSHTVTETIQFFCSNHPQIGTKLNKNTLKGMKKRQQSVKLTPQKRGPKEVLDEETKRL